MNSSTRIAMLLAAAVAVPALVTRAAPPEPSPAMSWTSEGGETFDLATLADGETRTFGEGDRAVSASRKGTQVTVEMARAPEGGEKTVLCTIGRDNCHIISNSAAGGRVALFLGSADADGHAPTFVHSFSGHEKDSEGKDVVIVRRISTGTPGAEPETIEAMEAMVNASASGAASRTVKVIHLEDEAGAPGSDSVRLRCSEGDTTMVVKKADGAAGFRCPKHGTALEVVKDAPMMRKVFIERQPEPVK